MSKPFYMSQSESQSGEDQQRACALSMETASLSAVEPTHLTHKKPGGWSVPSGPRAWTEPPHPSKSGSCGRSSPCTLGTFLVSSVAFNPLCA